jgi:hypothetical protein
VDEVVVKDNSLVVEDATLVVKSSAVDVEATPVNFKYCHVVAIEGVDVNIGSDSRC